MKWIEIRISTTEEAYDAVADMLTSIGAGGVAIEDPNDIRRQMEAPGSLDYADDTFIKSLGVDVLIKAYFQSETTPEELIQLVQEKMKFISAFLDTGKGFEGYSMVDDEDWATAWKKYYKPFHISSHVVIKPSWELYDQKAGEILIELDPGMAFGTGTHETTRLCAQLLERYVKKGHMVTDLGCGTGILAIIASKLGAGKVVAADVDEAAVKITLENCRINGAQDNVSAVAGTLDTLEKNKNDIIVANIIADVIIGISPMVLHYLKKDGYLITSGIIRERKEEVIDKYESSGFTVVEFLEMGEWVAIVFKCQDSL